MTGNRVAVLSEVKGNFNFSLVYVSLVVSLRKYIANQKSATRLTMFIHPPNLRAVVMGVAKFPLGRPFISAPRMQKAETLGLQVEAEDGQSLLITGVSDNSEVSAYCAVVSNECVNGWVGMSERAGVGD